MGFWGAYVGGAAAIVSLTVVGLRKLGGAIYRSLAPLPPTERQLHEECLEDHPLFRHLKMLRGKIAWRQIGQYPTPIHSVKATTPDGARIEFHVKREDLASSGYGGNKVRTLQHQLAACEAHQENNRDSVFTLMGSYGSNQVVATRVHGARTFHLEQSCIEALTFVPDEPDLDNTLNLLTSLSLGGSVVWAPSVGLWTLISRLWRPNDKVIPIGGHNVCGILGQIGACLELAEQIERGEALDPEAIYLAYGSGCTTTGLVVGVALARHLGLKAFRSPTFKIVAVVVHHGFGFLHRMFGALFWHGLPLSVSWSINAVTEYLATMGAPDLKQLCHETRERCLEIVTNPQFVGTYGSHSEKSLSAARSYDASGKVTGRSHQGFEATSSPLWLCGHFAAKPYAVMQERLNGGEHTGKNVLFWQTKSQTQPVAKGGDGEGMHEEARRFYQEAPLSLKRWADQGQAYSELRPGRWPDNYRQLMTEI